MLTLLQLSDEWADTQIEVPGAWNAGVLEFIRSAEEKVYTNACGAISRRWWRG
jgi:hypothetical protein